MSVGKMLDSKLSKQAPIDLSPHDVLLQPVPETPDQPKARQRRKKVKFTDLHTQQNFYVENAVIDAMYEILGDSWGEKSKFANEALKQYIRTKYPDLAVKLNGGGDSH